VTELLRGKNEANFSPNLDTGGYVIVINSKHSLITGSKMEKKNYYNHSGYPGGLRKRSLKEMIEKYPNELVQRIVKGMMPHNKLSNCQIKRLFVYSGSSHPHKSQDKKIIKVEV
jgi:large subunit ribosomal protein L13